MPEVAAQQRTILVVEDDDIVRMLIVEVLEELEFNVTAASDGPEALVVINSDQPLALMMTDVGLPGMDGRELAEKVRELRSELPILFASGYAESTGLAPGMQIIAKPFSIDQLREKVQSMIAG